MRTIATLGPSVQLVVFQFHVKNSSVPECIPKYSDFHKATASQFESTGVRIMEPTKDVLLDFISGSGYQLIDAWYKTEEEDWSRSVVRFVFCHKKYLNLAGLRPDFVAQQDSLLESFNRLTGKNLWKTMVHINPYFVSGKATGNSVLVLDCNSRRQTTKLVPVETGEFKSIAYYDPDFEDEEPIIEKEPIKILLEKPVMVFQGGREKLGLGIFSPGIGPQVLLTDKANRLKLVGNEIVLVAPAPVSEVVSAPVPVS